MEHHVPNIWPLAIYLPVASGTPAALSPLGKQSKVQDLLTVQAALGGLPAAQDAQRLVGS